MKIPAQANKMSLSDDHRRRVVLAGCNHGQGQVHEDVMLFMQRKVQHLLHFIEDAKTAKNDIIHAS
jgi:hypothetical protein